MKKMIGALFLSLFMVLSINPAQAEVREQTGITWYRMHFGLGVGSKSLNPEKFQFFMNTEVTPRFPEGLTMTISRGQWKSPQGLVKEGTVVIDIQVQPTAENEKYIAEIAKLYVEKFKNAKVSCFVIAIPNLNTTLYY